MILIDAEQLSKHKYVVGCDGAVDMRYISAVNVLAYKFGWNDALDSVERLAPAVDPVRHGHWELSPFDGNWMCSKCGNKPYHDNMKNMNYCPNCGAKMDEVKK